MLGLMFLQVQSDYLPWRNRLRPIFLPWPLPEPHKLLAQLWGPTWRVRGCFWVWQKQLQSLPVLLVLCSQINLPKKKNAESEGEVPLCPDSRDYEGGFAWASPAVSSVLLQHFSRAGNILVIDNWSWKCRIKSNRALKDQGDAYPLNIAAAPSTSISQDNIIPHSTLNSVRISHNWWLYVAMHTSRTCNSPLIALLWFKLSFFFFRLFLNCSNGRAFITSMRWLHFCSLVDVWKRSVAV